MSSDYDLEVVIVNLLRKRPGQRRDDLHNTVYGQKIRIDAAVDRLVAAGRVRETSVPGVRGVCLYVSRPDRPLPPPPYSRSAA